MTPLQASKLVAALAAAYPSNRLTDDSIAVYVRMLLDLDADATNAAVARLVATAKFPPTVAEIREAALALTSGEIRAGGEAWGDVLRAIRTYGYMRTPGKEFRFDDPVTHEAVLAMSWVDLCSSENATADRARFIELYDQLAGRHRRSQLSEGLPAMQRFRALQSGERGRLHDGQAAPLSEVLKLALSDADGEP